MSEWWRKQTEIFAELQGTTPEENVRRQIEGSPCTQNGWAIASIIFARARQYWHDFFDLEDLGPLAVWAGMFDDLPFMTPDIAEKCVDAVHAQGVKEPQLGHFYQAANKILAGDN